MLGKWFVAPNPSPLLDSAHALRSLDRVPRCSGSIPLPLPRPCFPCCRQVPSTRSLHALAWVNSMGLAPFIEGGLKGLCSAFKSGVLLCNLLERVVKPKPMFVSLVGRPLARKQALANIEQVF